jgi:hypothetical protein
MAALTSQRYDKVVEEVVVTPEQKKEAIEKAKRDHFLSIMNAGCPFKD